MSPFQYEYAKLELNVCGGGMNAETRMTCRGRISILGPLQVSAQANESPERFIFRAPGVRAESLHLKRATSNREERLNHLENCRTQRDIGSPTQKMCMTTPMIIIFMENGRLAAAESGSTTRLMKK
jgi:hypothetical protein